MNIGVTAQKGLTVFEKVRTELIDDMEDADGEGKLRLAVTSDGVNQTILFRETEQVPFSPMLTTSFKETDSPFLFTFDDKMLYTASNLGHDKTALVVFDPATAKEKEILFEIEI